MIQHINPRKTATAIAPMRQSAADGPEQWGKWVGRKSVLALGPLPSHGI